MRGTLQQLLAASLVLLLVLALAGAALAHGGEVHGDEEEAEPAPAAEAAAEGDPAPAAEAAAEGDAAPAADTAARSDAAPADSGQSDDGMAGMPVMSGTQGETGETEPPPPPPVEPLPPAPAALNLALAPAENGLATATATLTTADGQPIKGAAVTFRRKTTFGELQAGKVNTNARGEAQVRLPISQGQEVRVTAAFAGSARLAPAEAGTVLSVPAAPAPVQRPGMLTQRPSPWYLLALIVVVGGIWVTYGYVYWLLSRLGRYSVSEEAARAAAD